LHSTVRCDGEPSVFLWRHPPHVEHSESVIRYTPHTPQCRTATLWGKELAVDASPQDTHILQADGLQMVAETDAGHQCASRAVMKPAEIVEDQRLQVSDFDIEVGAMDYGFAIDGITGANFLRRGCCTGFGARFTPSVV